MVGGIFYIKKGTIPFADQLGFGIQRSTIAREKLPKDDCDPIDEWYQDDWGTWITEDSSEEKALISGLEYFYEKTGVRMMIVDANDITREILGKADALNEFTDRQLLEMIDDNPAGQSTELTPFILIRKAAD